MALEKHGGIPTDTTAPDRVWELASRVIDLARGQIVADNPFVSASLSLLQAEPTSLDSAFATNGKSLFVNADQVLRDFAQSKDAPTSDLAHVLLHCVLLHPFVGSDVDGPAWDLASDIVAESLARELVGQRTGERGNAIEAVLAQLSRDLSRQLTTERIYRALREGTYDQTRRSWAALFHVDDHSLWPSSGGAQEGGQSGIGPGTGEDASDAQASHSPRAAQLQDQVTEQTGKEHSPSRCDSSSTAGKNKDPQAGAPEDKAADDRDQDQHGGAGATSAPREPSGSRKLSPTELDRAEKAWERAAKSMRVDLQTLSRQRGAGMGGLVRELEVKTHERIDYREFLRQFAVEHEDMRLSDDEFDYVFYTYGLELYGNVPLVEPLEYRNERRIRDFAIVIDTSSSVQAKVVQEFVNTTFDVLSSESGFFSKTNIHIIQADARVQSDVKITCMADLDRWRRSVRLRGFGGTDFRPAFAYVQQLRQAGEFDDLQGLVYFTDGWGIYPQRMPPYKCAFVFYDEDHRPELVPPWAIQVVLHPGEYESLSVY